jgi:hypothetical protein
MISSEKQRQIYVPTDNVKVQATLRELEEPICKTKLI